MKKLMIAAAALLLGVSASAQHFGVIGGLTTSTTNLAKASKELTDGTIARWHAGVAYNQPLFLGLRIQPALIYDVKGAQMKDVSGIGSIDFTTGYLELPVQLQYGWDVLGMLRPYVMLEPFIGYALYNDQKVTIKTSGGSNDNWANVASRFEGGLGLGAGVDVFKHVQVSLRWYWNFGSVYKSEIKKSIDKLWTFIAFLAGKQTYTANY